MPVTTTYPPDTGQERRHVNVDRRRATPRADRDATLRNAGIAATYAALAIIFLWIGAMKFTAYEAQGIAPFISNSPLLSWMHGAFGIKGAAW